MSASVRVAIVADDLTGAADTAVVFARRGLTTLVVLDQGPLPVADVLALSTESRHLPEDAARQRVTAAARRLAAAIQSDHAIIYKKIDSTLRGNPGAELDALMTTLGIEQALAAPAFPAQGRTTVAGRQRVDGRLLADTPFGTEVGTSRADARLAVSGRPIASLDIDRVRAGVEAAGAVIAAAARSIVVADAETDGDLAILVEAGRRAGLRLLCGSAGLAGALAASLPSDGAAGHDPPPTPTGPCLIVAASRHPRTIAQVEALRLAEIPVLVPPLAYFIATDGEAGRLADEAGALLARCGALVLTTAGLAELPLDPSRVARRLAAAVPFLARSGLLGGLVLTGGDVAAAVCAELDASAFRLHGEVEPGMPWGTLEGGAASGAYLVTKAGGFGDDRTLLSAMRWLTSR